MEAVYVLEPGSYIRREGTSLKVVKGGKVLEQIPADGLKRLMLVGYVSLTGGVLDFLIRNRVETVFMTPTGRFRARLSLDEHGHVALRRAQYLQLSRKEFALETARTVVSGKIRNMLRLTLLRARQYGDETLKIAAASLNSASAHLKDIN
jgi:CRISP-associated protein Cas1